MAAIPTDRPLAFSIEPNGSHGEDQPKYRLMTVVITLSQEELEERFRRFMEEQE